jgi:formylglycine-generating enzyme required for sulfatase activity
VVLAGQCTVDAGPRVVGGQVVERLIPRLVETMQGLDVPIHTRADAGQVLDELGWLPEDLDAFLSVPATKPFYYAQCKPAFWMARYPVTNAQYERFIQAGGYGERRWWSDEGWKYRQERLFWPWEEQEMDRPCFWDDPHWNRKSYPMVGATWYEAKAYCNWLTEQMREAGCRIQVVNAKGEIGELRLDNCRVRLPTKVEWLLAAQGQKRREYPWGNRFDPARANTSESNLRSTTPVAMYPAGASMYGVWDMAGNVWEWTSSCYPGVYVVCGGSWFNYQVNARCAGDVHYCPDIRDRDLGFRVVVSPGSP